MEYLLGTDIGTSSIKTSLFTLDGKEVSSSTIEYELHCVKCGGVEQNAEDWWQAFKTSIQDTPQDPRRAGRDRGHWSQLAELGSCPN